MKNLSCKYPKCVIIVKGNIHSQRRSHFAYWLMNVHNVMEEYVEKNVNGLYKNLMEEKTPWIPCDCENCRLDAISYVLNRLTPRYIVSGRGAVYAAQFLESSQLNADVTALSMEAIRVIASVQRPYHKTSAKPNASSAERKKTSPVFNFPVISGAVYYGTTFEPVIGAEISLLDQNGIVAMHDFSWPNPATTFSSTKGSFSFWPKELSSATLNETKKFSFTVEAKAEGYPAVRQGFEIVLMSESERKTTISQSLTMKVQDLILFKD